MTRKGLTIHPWLHRFLADDTGQDLIEYGLLLGMASVGALLVLQNLPGRMGAAFQQWENGTYNCWTPAAPGAGGCGP